MASKAAAAEIRPPYQFEWVKWYPNGRREGQPFGVMVLEYNHNNAFAKIFIPTPRRNGAQVLDGVPHISDKLLQNPQAAIHTGGWELSDGGVDFRGFADLVGELAVRSGLVQPAKPGPPKKEKADFKPEKAEAKSA